MIVSAIESIPQIGHGDRLSDIICETVELQDGDVLVVASKVVAKSQGRVVACDRSDMAARRALILSESRRVLRERDELMITETHHGFICANAGIDWSNAPVGHAVLLPRDPDRSARKIRDSIRGRTGTRVAVIISDTFGRTWREGAVEVAIGSAGITPVIDLRNSNDMFGQTLQSTQICIADQLAATAGLLMSKASGTPVVLVRGLGADHFSSAGDDDSIATNVIRPAGRDLFR